MDAQTREIVGVYKARLRSAHCEAIATKRQLRNYGIHYLRLPTAIRRCFATANRSSDYRQCAVAYSDFWAAYGAVFPIKRHKAQRVRAERP